MKGVLCRCGETRPEHTTVTLERDGSVVVFLTNCTIWIEGISDRIYIRKYLEIYQENLRDEEPRFREDVHYSLAEYAGANLGHWLFAETDEESGEPDEKERRIDAVLDPVWLDGAS